MDITIPFRFRQLWNNFFGITLPNFLGNVSSDDTPIRFALVSYCRLLLAFLIVWVLVNLVVKVIKEIGF